MGRLKRYDKRVFGLSPHQAAGLKAVAFVNCITESAALRLLLERELRRLGYVVDDPPLPEVRPHQGKPY